MKNGQLVILKSENGFMPRFITRLTPEVVNMPYAITHQGRVYIQQNKNEKMENWGYPGEWGLLYHEVFTMDL